MQVDIKLQKINPTIWWWVVGRWVGQGQDHKLKKLISRDPTSKFWQYNLKLSLKDCIFWTTGRILKLQKSKKLRILPAFEWNYLQSCTGKGKENRRQKIEQKVQWKLKKA